MIRCLEGEKSFEGNLGKQDDSYKIPEVISQVGDIIYLPELQKEFAKLDDLKRSF